MGQRETCSVTMRLAPQAGTATLFRIISVLHGRGVDIHDLTFATGSAGEVTVTACVTLGNLGRTTLEGVLRRILEVIDVSTQLERSLDLTSVRG